MSTYFILDPFEFPYYFYHIRGELIYVLSIVVCIPSTFCLTLGHHQSTRDIYNYGQYINQFLSNTIKVIQECKRIQKKICRHKMSIMFNEICINEEMLPKYTYIYIYICVCVCVCVCMCVCVLPKFSSYIYIYACNNNSAKREFKHREIFIMECT